MLNSNIGFLGSYTSVVSFNSRGIALCPTFCICLGVCLKSNYLCLFFGSAGSLLLHADSSLVVLSRDYSGGSVRACCSGFACGAWPLGAQVSVVVAHGLSCHTGHGIFPDQGLN